MGFEIEMSFRSSAPPLLPGPGQILETSGLGLSAQASKLMDPNPVKKEEDIADQLEEWVQKCDRLARHGSQYELPTMYKTVALGKILIGETKRAYESWKLEGLPYEKFLAKQARSPSSPVSRVLHRPRTLPESQLVRSLSSPVSRVLHRPRTLLLKSARAEFKE